MKNFEVLIRVDSGSLAFFNSIIIKADSFIHSYDLALDIVSNSFSDDFNYTIVEIKEYELL